MKAAVLREPNKPLSIEDITISKPGPREVLVRLKAIGVCHSDVHFWNGSFPAELPTILGHESAGVVEQVGSMVSYVKPGDHVISILSPFCGACEHCATGHMSVCHTQNGAEFSRADNEPPRLMAGKEKVNQFLRLSSFAEQILVHENTLCKIDKEMPMDRAALIGWAASASQRSTAQRLRALLGSSRSTCSTANLRWRKNSAQQMSSTRKTETPWKRLKN